MSDVMMNTDDLSADYRVRELEARLDRRLTELEQQKNRLRWAARMAAVATVLAAGAVVWVGRAEARQAKSWSVNTLSTSELVLEDAEGLARGRLATDAEGRAELTLSDRDGRERIRLTVLADGSPGVTISDADARPRAVLGYLPDGSTNLVLADAWGVSRAVFGLEADGAAQALFTDPDGDVRTLVGVGADGVSSVSTYEAVDDDSAGGSS
jgi:hypothetical protein